MKDDCEASKDSALPEFDMSPEAIERRLYELCSVSRLAIELSNSVVVGRTEDLLESKKMKSDLENEEQRR